MPTYDLDGVATPHVTAVTLSGGGSNLTADFGYRYSGAYSISGTVFFDAGNDGGLYVSGSDNPYANITVYLWRDGVIIGTTTTGPNGAYTFPNLPEGDYVVSVNRNAPELRGMTQTTPTPTPYHRSVTISGSDVTQQDFGFYAALDFGDLPDSYGTNFASDGARHLVPSSGAIKLGATVTYEGDARAPLDATGDGGDDGVVVVGKWADGSDGATVGVTVNGCTGTCYLSAWIDWNKDGDFADANEAVLIDAAAVNGSNTLSFDVPTGTFDGTTIVLNARFRLYATSTRGTAAPTDLVENGEVEDYQWTFTPNAVRLAAFGARAETAGLGFILVGGLLLSASYLLIRRRR